MENERTRISLIQEAILAALGCTKIDYRSQKQMDEAAGQIAVFVEDILIRAEKARAEAINAIFADGQGYQRGFTNGYRRALEDCDQSDDVPAVTNGTRGGEA